MKKIFFYLITIASSINMYCSIPDDIDSDNIKIVEEINQALQILELENNQTPEQRYNDLIKEHEKSPYSILNEDTTISNIETKIAEKLQEIVDAYQVLKVYNLANKTLFEIQTITTPFVINNKIALQTLGLNQEASWDEINNVYQIYEMGYQDMQIDDKQMADVDKAYAFLLENYMPDAI